MEKLYISADIEGTCGIVNWVETEIGESQGEFSRNEMTMEVASACKAALECGVKDILVKDAHGSGRSINPLLLPKEVRLLRAWANDPYSMMAGLDKNFGGVFFTGYHSAAGTDGNPLSHTMNTQNVYVMINGVMASEFMINSYTAGLNNVPVLMLTGDVALCSTAGIINPNIKTVAVSEGIGNASISINPVLAHEKIAQAAEEALSLDTSKMQVNMPDKFNVSIRFKQHYTAKDASYYPGAKKTSAYEVSYSSNDWNDVLAFFFYNL